MNQVNLHQLHAAIAQHKLIEITYSNANGHVHHYVCINQLSPVDSGADNELSFGDNSKLTNESPKRYSPLSFGDNSTLSHATIDTTNNYVDSLSEQGKIQKSTADSIKKELSKHDGKNIYVQVISKNGEKYTKPQYRTFSIEKIQSFKITH